LRFQKQQHKKYWKEKDDGASWQKRREYELMLMRRFNLKKQIRLLQRSIAANEISIKDYETAEDTKEFACKVREEVWENRSRKNWHSDTSFADEHVELGYYVLTLHEKELASTVLIETVSMRDDDISRRLETFNTLDAQKGAL
jgi:phosphoribosyl-ATP pyrophosphohydrolase